MRDFGRGRTTLENLTGRELRTADSLCLATAPVQKRTFRSEFILGQFEEDVVQESVKVGLQMDPQRPNVFVEWAKLPILDPARITVPTMIIHGEKDFAAKEEDLLPFYSQLNTHDKRCVLLPDGGHMLILEKGHRRFEYEVLSFFDRP
jgi:pimeloyl-ACP methyl ester carboxylesterase